MNVYSAGYLYLSTQVIEPKNLSNSTDIPPPLLFSHEFNRSYLIFWKDKTNRCTKPKIAYRFETKFIYSIIEDSFIFFHSNYKRLQEKFILSYWNNIIIEIAGHTVLSGRKPSGNNCYSCRSIQKLGKNKKTKKNHLYAWICTLFLAKARVPSPPQASLGRITESTSLANMKPLSMDSEFLTKYCGALLKPASTHGKNV